MSNSANYAAPWAEPIQVSPGRVELVEYGPQQQAYEQQIQRHKAWSWRPDGRRIAPDHAALIAWMTAEPREVSRREQQVYDLVCTHGKSLNFAARMLAIKRDDVKIYLRRLRLRAAKCTEPLAKQEAVCSK